MTHSTSAHSPKTSHPSHCFLVPAYQNSPYLRDCLESLVCQKIRSPILIATSTPFDGLDELAKSYGAELFIHGPNIGMAEDWNAGLAQVKTEWVTIAHQDDMYDPAYTLHIFAAIAKAENPNLVFSDYIELIDQKTRSMTLLLLIKKCLLEFGFLGRDEIFSRLAKMNALRFGNPIPCPAVTFRPKSNTQHFAAGFHVNMDWDAWIRKVGEAGSFVWVRKRLMIHRIHRDSGTTEGIAAGHRAREDYDMLKRLWSTPFAWLISKTYWIAYASNRH